MRSFTGNGPPVPLRILEATIAVMIVSGVMVAVYSDQSTGEDVTVEDYFYSLKSEILADISSNNSLRLEVLNVTYDNASDPSYVVLDEFVESKTPDFFGYLLRICNLGDLVDFCKMDSTSFIESLESDVFVEEVVISAELGNGTSAGTYSPKIVKLFFWEEVPGGACIDTEDTVVICDGVQCGEVADACDVARDCEQFCVAPDSCVAGVCEAPPAATTRLTCKADNKRIVKSDCVGKYDDECWGWGAAGGFGKKTGSCGFLNTDDDYECWIFENITTDCSANPTCPSGYSPISGSEESCSAGALCGDCSAGDPDIYECSSHEVLIVKSCVASGGGCYNYNHSSPALECFNIGGGQTCWTDGSSGSCVAPTAPPCVGGCDITAPRLRYCDPTSSFVEEETCVYNSVDSCYEFGDNVLYEDCAPGVCTGTGVCVGGVASLRAVYETRANTTLDYFYDVTLHEDNEVEVHIYEGIRCYLSKPCEIPYPLDFYVPAGGSNPRTNNNFRTLATPDTATYTYYGIDAKGNEVEVSFSISTTEYL